MRRIVPLAEFDRLAAIDSISGSYALLTRQTPCETNCWSTGSSAPSRVAPMNVDDAPPLGERRGDSRHAGQLVGRESEMERIRAFLAAVRTDGEALLVTGKPGGAK